MELYVVFFLIAVAIAIGGPAYLFLTKDRRRRALLNVAADTARQKRFHDELGFIAIDSAADFPAMIRSDNVLSATMEVQYVAQSKANLSSAMGRAAVGGAVAGPVGAAVGAITGTRTERPLISGIQVHVTGKDGSHRTIEFHSGEPRPESELSERLQAARSAAARLNVSDAL